VKDTDDHGVREELARYLVVEIDSDADSDSDPEVKRG
jgi:hypothetical protein